MGKINKGLLGAFSGTVGTVIGGTWKGIAYMRSRPTRRSADSFSVNQRNQQMKFALVSRFMRTFSGLTELTFKDYAIKMTGRNYAMSHLLKNAITGVAPLYELDFSKVLISKGQLEGALNPITTALGVGKVNFSWENNAGIGDARVNDKAIVVVHCPELNQSVYTIMGADRMTGNHVLEVPTFSNKLVHTYLGFISTDGRKVATSVYTGTVTVN